MPWAISVIEFALLVLVGMLLLSPILLLIVILTPPKTPNKGTLIALLIGPLAYIYVGKWGKALGLFVLGWITAGIGHLIIYPYSWFNIRTEVRRYMQNQQIREAQLRQAEKGPPEIRFPDDADAGSVPTELRLDEDPQPGLLLGCPRCGTTIQALPHDEPVCPRCALGDPA